MKKTIAMLLAFVMIFALCACGQTAAPAATSAPVEAPAEAPAEEAAPVEEVAPKLDITPRTIRFSTTSAEGMEMVNAMNKFADLVKEASGGLMNVEVYPGSQLGDTTVAVQNVQLGVQEMTVATSNNVAAAGVKNFSAFALPYVFRDNDHVMDVLQGDIGQELLASIADTDARVVGIGYWFEGTRNFITKEPVRCLEDIKGMKIRCQANDIDTAMTKALGASPTPIAFGELYTALQTGVVDGCENPLSGIYNSKFQEVCKYLTLDAHSALPVVILFSQSIWNNMSADEQEIIKTCWAEASAHNREWLKENQENYIKLFEEAGVEVIELEDQAAWVEAMAPVYEEYGGAVADLLARIAAVN